MFGLVEMSVPAGARRGGVFATDRDGVGRASETGLAVCSRFGLAVVSSHGVAGPTPTVQSSWYCWCCLPCWFGFGRVFVDSAHAVHEHVQSTILWKYPTDAFYLGEHTPACETFRGVECIEHADVDLQRFTVTGRPLPARWRKDESTSERIVLRIEK